MRHVSEYLAQSFSEEYRAKCEANWLAQKTVPEIRAQLELTEKRRGKAAADKLRQAVREIWKERTT